VPLQCGIQPRRPSRRSFDHNLAGHLSSGREIGPQIEPWSIDACMNDATKAIVNQISKIDLSGNIVPMSWFAHVTHNGRPQLAAIIILSEIVFWYRWRENRDERTGRVVGYEVRFAGDKFCRSLKSWAEMLGLTVKQVRTAIETLKELGLVTVELRPTPGAPTAWPSTFIEPVPALIARITYSNWRRSASTKPRALQGTGTPKTAVNPVPYRARAVPSGARNPVPYRAPFGEPEREAQGEPPAARVPRVEERAPEPTARFGLQTVGAVMKRLEVKWQQGENRGDAASIR
jgi:hypothetical protein